MATNPPAPSGVRTVHVEGRTPGAAGKAPMVTIEDGVPNPTGVAGSHHEAVYLAAIAALADVLQDGDRQLAVTSPSEHLVEQMNGAWEVGDELRPYHGILTALTAMFPDGVVWSLGPRTRR